MTCSLHLRILLPRLSMGAEIPVCPGVSHTEDAQRKKGRRQVLGVPELPNVCSSPPPRPLRYHRNNEAADPSSQRQDTSEGMSTPPGQALGKWHGKGEIRVQLCGAIINDKGEITGTSKSVQRKLVTDEGKRQSSRTVEGTHGAGSGAGRGSTKPRGCWKRAHVGSTSSPEQSGPKQHAEWKRRKKWPRSKA